ncbi:MAG: hypothetical protein N3D10_03260 [Candidatus Micrarchaeota archaeon]|nr:hypothetical protein [Candidatus Micrarchaeota archaeon]
MKQISVVVDNQIGKLADISFILGKSKINIDSISMGEAAGKSIIHLTVKNYEKALELLKANGYECYSSDVFLVKLKNSPGELAKLTKLLEKEKINIENVTVITQDSENSLYSIKVDKTQKAEKILKNNNYLVQENI